MNDTQQNMSEFKKELNEYPDTVNFAYALWLKNKAQTEKIKEVREETEKHIEKLIDDGDKKGLINKKENTMETNSRFNELLKLNSEMNYYNGRLDVLNKLDGGDTSVSSILNKLESE